MIVLFAGVPATAARHAAGGDGPAPAASPRIFVSIRDFAFDPDNIEVPLGGTVRWTNEGDVAHTVTSDSGRFLSQRIQPGGSYEYRFDTSGTFYYHDSLYSRMRASVEVRATGPTSSSTATAATTAPTTAPTTVPSSSPTSVGPPDNLAYTGAGTGWLIAAGLLLCAVGVLVLAPFARPALVRGPGASWSGRTLRTRGSRPSTPRRSRTGVDDPLAGPGR